MKYYFALFSLLCLHSGFSQQILNTAETASRTVSDPKTVILSPGFTANSQTVNPFIAKIGESSVQSVNAGTTNSTAGENNLSGQIGSGNFHDTKGDISVSGGGQLLFSLPIALPPSINGVAPQMNLSYSSGSGTGIAGMGFSISGINNISRVGKNIEKDGESKGVQLNYSDYFEFNGQRLLLKTPGDINSYGKDGTEYVTEKLSTLKVKSVGMINDQNYTGPNSFEVTFDNGSQAWYGTTPDSKNPVEYNIVKWKDAQGNYITYNYSKTNNVVVVSSVEWGGNEVMGTPHFNSIIFNYSSRNTKEVSFIHGVKFVQDKILKSIVVNTNNQQFKKYVISHGIDEVVSNIIEYNSQNQAANPVYFSYENSLDSNRSGVKNYDDNENNKVVGDFDGDGVLDYLKYFDGKPETTICLDYGESSSNRPECTKWGIAPAIAKGVQLIKSFLDEKTAQMLSVDVTQFSKEEFNKAIAITFKNSKNEISARQGIFITKVKEENGEFFIEGQIYAVNDNNQLVPQFDRPFVFKNTHKNLFTENQNGDYYSSTTITSMLMETRQLDLDGDGVSEIILNFNDFTSIEHRSNIDEVLQRKASTKRVASNQVINTYNYYRYLILNLNPTSSPSNTFKETATFHINIFDKPLIGDFKGDGKISILKIHGNSSYAQLFSFKKDKISNDFSLETTEVPFVFKGLFDNAIVGDFNGDKKSDLIIPQADNSATWNLYLANGKGFKEEVKTNLVVFNKTIEAKDSCGFFDLQCKKFNERKVQSYQALDIDKDGKSELIQFKYDTRNYFNTRKLSYSDNTVRVFRNSGFNGTSDVNFSMMYQDYFRESGFHIFSELVGDFQINQVNNSIVLIGREAYEGISGKLYTYNFADRSKKALVKSITQGNLTTTIEYKELDSKVNPSFYAPIKKERYPIVELERVSQSFAVARLTQLDRKQDFIYRGLLAHVNGRGMIGFRKIARSNWYADGFENTKVWSATEIDPLQNGMVIKEWNTRNASDIFPDDVSLNTTQLLSLKLMEYTTEKSVTGVESILPYRSIEKDFLKNVTKESTIFYIGNFKVVDRVETSINGGYATTISKNEYFNDNLSGVGKDYYVGRIASKSETVKAYGDTKKSKTAFTFENNLPKTITTFNQDESQTITETYTYDGFGNVIEKNVSNSQDAQTQNNKNQYDSKGLFVIKTTDNLGLIAETTYNNYGQVLTQSDPLGNINTNTYDAWGKLTKSKSNLSGTTTYTYEKQGDDVVTSQYDPTGDVKETRTNKLGQQYQSMTKGFENGTYVFKKVEYDLVGRKIKESEPYFANEAPKWNTITYDDSVFPAKATVSSFNGAITETQVLGTTTLIKELNGYNRTTRKTTDVLGNQMESEDKGGIISFTYNAAGQNLKAIYGQNVVTTKYDTWGRKSEFHDPSNGKYSYAYNGFSQLLKETSPKGIKEYIYNNKGQLTAQKEMSTDDSAKATNKSITFTYNSKGMITDKKGTANGKDYLTYLTYDASGRVLTVSENSNGKYYFKKNIAYDDKGRVTSYDKGLYSSGILTQTTLENVYSSWSGAHYQLKDKNASKILWQLNTAKANGLVLKANLGNVAIENQYDGNNFLTKVVHASAVQPNVLQLTYAFDAIKNELKSRSRAGTIAINEVFSYDDNNRLTNWTNPKTGLISSNGYDEKGRILNNDQTGTTTFKNDKIYQAASQQLNAAGIQNFSNDIPQIITYNENNDPVYIDGQKGDAFFGYGLTEMRQSVTYGGNFNPEQGQQGKFTKYYSEDGSYEITTNNTTGQEKHILYLEGSPYESDIVFVKNYSDTAAKYLFLHKDYIGSILAITDEAGTAVEQRHFDAWGNLSSYATANGLTIPSTVAGSMLIDRGYTSHEHFTELGIIHMNGRLYDPLQRRFLNADENIQDPNNTQCYNKYGYAMNNPLLYNDPSGEIIPALVVAFLIGAAVGVASYAIGSYFTYGSWEKVGLSGALKAAFWGAVSGAVTFGIGECFTTVTGGIKAATAFSKTFGGVLVKAAAHGISQGTLAMMQNNGAGFLSGASGGFFGSLGATAWGGAGGKWGGIGGKYASSTVGTIAFGALSGGVGAELSGGNFWQGAVTGGIVAGLNDAMHKGFAKKYKLHVLEDYEGANGAGHQALVGDVDGDLFYVSKDGTNENNGVYGEVKNTIKTFDSFEAIDDYYSTKVSPGKHYDSKLTFKVTKAQMQTALKTAIRWAKMPYNLMNNSCTTIVQVGLINAGILNIKNFDMIPNQSFKVMSQIKYKPAY